MSEPEILNPFSRRAPIQEHQGEPVPGLPAMLPEGETMLWQGAPEPGLLARRVFHIRGIALYFAVLATWRAASLWHDGATMLDVAAGVLLIVGVGAIPVAILAAMARLAARTTLYTLTDKRLVMRVGVALPMTLNVPFNLVASAEARIDADGSGDVMLALTPPARISWVVLWPHMRPWRFGQPEPMLRDIADAAHVASILSRALAAHASQAVPPRRVDAAVSTPIRGAVAA